MTKNPELLDSLSLTVPPDALEHYESALSAICRAVSFFHDEANNLWELQGVKERGAHEAELAAALAMAEFLSGHTPAITRATVPVGGWLERTRNAFPEQQIGRRFVVRGSHISAAAIPGRITLTLDAGLAFGTGEHNSTRGCLVALERIARHHRPLKSLDLGTGSGVLAIAAARLFHRPVLATDNDPRAARVAAANARLNGVAPMVTAICADGWQNRRIKRNAPYNLVFANILARPLCAMAADLAKNLAPGGIAILAGLLTVQANWVIAAHRRAGLVLKARHRDGAWTTLIFTAGQPAQTTSCAAGAPALTSCAAGAPALTSCAAGAPPPEFPAG